MPAEDRRRSRREILRMAMISGGSLLFGFATLDATFAQDDFAGGEFLGLANFVDEGFAPVNTRFGSELDARLYTDLSRLSGHMLVTPTAEFYLRTGASRLLPDADKWTVRVDGLIDRPFQVGIHELRNAAKHIGLHLMECSGNVSLALFGLMSVADWAGIPFGQIADRAKRKPNARWVLVSGFDRYSQPSDTSIPGASWIFRLEELEAAGAFLATEMNGVPLTRDHGAPVRLMVPGWYGCVSIKWVDRISFVDDSAPSTSQMREYAARTLQNGIPQLARDFQPAVIDVAALPARVEKWLVGGKIKYRVAGLLWGGAELVRVLKIRFNPEEEYVPVAGFHEAATDPWTLWTHTWTPRAPGTYLIRLAVADPQMRARKLDMGYYVRAVEIDEV
jgi:DMSO/TMAO reductase YedYZ molybdopterin-dependent catalytic subunit